MALVAWGDAWRSGVWRVGAWAEATLATVPDVTGLSEAQAISDITTAGFIPSKSEDYSITVVAGLVISQSPAGGSSAQTGSTVAFVVSLGERASAGGLSRQRRRYFVEVDGQYFQVNDASEARAILERARALAEREAEQAAASTARKAAHVLRKGRRLGKLRVPVPHITVSPAIAEQTASLIADIDRLYRQAAELQELRLLLERKFQEEDDEEILTLLM